jgi:hypothetical protein
LELIGGGNTLLMLSILKVDFIEQLQYMRPKYLPTGLHPPIEQT